MSKSYDLSKKSDMRKFQSDLESQVIDAAKQTAMGEKYDVECPHCGQPVTVPVGKSRCPKCKNIIDLTLDFNF